MEKLGLKNKMETCGIDRCDNNVKVQMWWGKGRKGFGRPDQGPNPIKLCKKWNWSYNAKLVR